MMFRRQNACGRRPNAAEPVVPIRFLDDEPAPKPQAQAQAQAPPAAPAKPKRRREWPIGTLAFLAVVGAGLVLHKAGVVHSGREFEEEVDRTFAVDGTARLVVETFNGPVEVTRGESGRIECVVTKRGQGPDEAAALAAIKAVQVDMEQEGTTVRVKARRDAGADGHRSGAAVRVEVPEGTAVRLESDNGMVKVIGVAGPVEARTDNGAIEVRDAVESVTATTSNGRISCDADRALVHAETANGAIDVRGRLADGQNSIRTRNGKITVKLPASQSFRVDARTGNGKVSTDFDGLEVSGRKGRGRALDGEVGDDPRAVLKVRTDNGSIRILEDGE